MNKFGCVQITAEIQIFSMLDHISILSEVQYILLLHLCNYWLDFFKIKF